MEQKRVPLFGMAIALCVSVAMLVTCLFVSSKFAYAEGRQIDATIENAYVNGRLLDKNKVNNFTDNSASNRFSIEWSANAGRAIETGDYFTIDIDQLLTPSNTSRSGDVLDEFDPDIKIGTYKFSRLDENTTRITITFNDALNGREHVRGNVWFDCQFNQHVKYNDNDVEDGCHYVIHPQGYVVNGVKSDGNYYAIKVKEVAQEKVDLEKSHLQSAHGVDKETGNYYMAWVQWAVLVDGSKIVKITDSVRPGALYETDKDGNLIYEIGEVTDSPDDPYDYDYNFSHTRNYHKFKKLSEEEKKSIASNVTVTDSKSFSMDLAFPKDKYYIIVYKTVEDDSFSHMTIQENDVTGIKKDGKKVYGNQYVFLPSSGAEAYGDSGYLLAKKTDTEGNPIAGAVFNLLRQKSDGTRTTLKQVTSNKQGYIYVEDLRTVGVTYLLEEVKAPAPFVKLEEPVEVKPRRSSEAMSKAYRENDQSVLDQYATQIVNLKEGEEPPTPTPDPEPEPSPQPTPGVETPTPQPSATPQQSVPTVESTTGQPGGKVTGGTSQGGYLPKTSDACGMLLMGGLIAGTACLLMKKAAAKLS